MEIMINYSDMKFYDENYEKLIHTVLTKGAELQKVPTITIVVQHIFYAV